MFIDTHAHLTDLRLDAKQILADMDKDKLSRIVTVGFDYSTSLGALKIAKSDSRVFSSVGIHPSDAKSFTEKAMDEFLALSKEEKVVAVGEIGLDYHYPDFDKDTQIKVFIRQLELAKAAQLPVIIHMRDADEDTLKILTQHKDKISNGGVMHCYSGSFESSKRYIDLGLHLSFTGALTFRNAKHAPEVVSKAPIDRLVIETDCPYLAPEPFRGKTNYPKYLVLVAEKMAEIRGISVEEIGRVTSNNAFKLFPKMK